MHDKKNLHVTVSGGLSSATVAAMVHNSEKVQEMYNDIVYIFCNTGMEHPKTYEFLRKLETELNLPVVWLEAVISQEKGVGVRHKIVDYKSAHRGAAIFDALCRKLGLPSRQFRHCTRDLKQGPAESFLRELGGTWEKTLGIRSDEPSRLKRRPGRVYPLAGDIFNLYADQAYVRKFWKAMPFDLGLPSRKGNCMFCFQKSKKKLIANYNDDDPAMKRAANQWQDLEEKHTDGYTRFDMRSDSETVSELRRRADFAKKNPQTEFQLGDNIDESCFCGNV